MTLSPYLESTTSSDPGIKDVTSTVLSVQARSDEIEVPPNGSVAIWVFVVPLLRNIRSVPFGWLLPTILTSAYILSRGIAKSGERDPNPQQFQQNHGMQGGMQDGYADQGMSRERQTETYGTVPR